MNRVNWGELCGLLLAGLAIVVLTLLVIGAAVIWGLAGRGG